MELLGTVRIRTTTYHPIANGMIERFHRQLKAALKCHPQPDKWTDSLPLVLLGIRTALKQDLQCTSAELVYGTTLRLPGAFFSPASCTAEDPANYVQSLKSIMQNLCAVPPRANQPYRTFMDPALHNQTHVFVRYDGVRKPLQQPYDGPFKVITHTKKHFTVAIKGRQEVVSINRLKPVYLELTADTEIPTQFTPVVPTPVDHPPKSVVTHSGRRVHIPDRLDL